MEIIEKYSWEFAQIIITGMGFGFWKWVILDPDEYNSKITLFKEKLLDKLSTNHFQLIRNSINDTEEDVLTKQFEEYSKTTTRHILKFVQVNNLIVYDNILRNICIASIVIPWLLIVLNVFFVSRFNNNSDFEEFVTHMQGLFFLLVIVTMFILWNLSNKIKKHEQEFVLL